MKAIVQDRYGSGDLEVREIDLPQIKDKEVLVRVCAFSATTFASDLPAAVRYIGRTAARMGKPKDSVPGMDLAGQVEAVGGDVTRFRSGDEVFGWAKGTFAEYVAASEDALALKPANMSFEQSAVIAISGFTALQGLRDKGRIQPGQKVLILGASGGVGTSAVQVAKAFGAEVTGVCSGSNVDLVRSIGADQVIDYTKEDFTQSGQRYDLILDMAGVHSLAQYRSALTPRGTLVMVGSSGVALRHPYLRGMGRWSKALVLSSFSRQRLRALLQTRNQEDLAVLQDLMESGKLTPVISARYSLSEAPEAVRHFEEGHVQGRAVVTV